MAGCVCSEGGWFSFIFLFPSPPLFIFFLLEKTRWLYEPDWGSLCSYVTEMHPWTLLPALQKHRFISYSVVHSSLPETFNNCICSSGFSLGDFSLLTGASLSEHGFTLPIRHNFVELSHKCAVRGSSITNSSLDQKKPKKTQPFVLFQAWVYVLLNSSSSLWYQHEILISAPQINTICW